MTGDKNSLALSECIRRMGGLEPPVSALRSSKEDCKQGKTTEACRLSTPNAQTTNLMWPRLQTQTKRYWAAFTRCVARPEKSKVKTGRCLLPFAMTTLDLEHRDPSDGMGTPQCLFDQDNPESTGRATVEFESFALLRQLYISTPMAGSSGDGSSWSG